MGDTIITTKVYGSGRVREKKKRERNRQNLVPRAVKLCFRVDQFLGREGARDNASARGSRGKPTCWRKHEHQELNGCTVIKRVISAMLKAGLKWQAKMEKKGERKKKGVMRNSKPGE